MAKKESPNFRVYQLSNNLYGIYLKATGEMAAQVLIYPNLPTLMAAEMLSEIVAVYDHYAKALRG